MTAPADGARSPSARSGPTVEPAAPGGDTLQWTLFGLSLVGLAALIAWSARHPVPGAASDPRAEVTAPAEAAGTAQAAEAVVDGAGAVAVVPVAAATGAAVPRTEAPDGAGDAAPPARGGATAPRGAVASLGRAESSESPGEGASPGGNAAIVVAASGAERVSLGPVAARGGVVPPTGVASPGVMSGADAVPPPFFLSRFDAPTDAPRVPERPRSDPSYDPPDPPDPSVAAPAPAPATDTDGDREASVRAQELAVLAGLSERLRYAPGESFPGATGDDALVRMVDPLSRYPDLDVIVSVRGRELEEPGRDASLARERAGRIVDRLVGLGLSRGRFLVRLEPDAVVPVPGQQVRVAARGAGS